MSRTPSLPSRLIGLFDARRFARYAVAGFAATIFDFVVLTAMVRYLHMDSYPWYVLAATVAFIGATVVHFAISYLWVFNDRRHNKYHQFVKFAIVAVLGITVNNTILVLIVEHTSLLAGWESSYRILLAKVVATAVVSCGNFVVNNRWSFRDHSSTNATQL